MTNKVTKYGLMTIAAVLLVAMAFAGTASADVIAVEPEHPSSSISVAIINNDGSAGTLELSSDFDNVSLIANEANWKYIAKHSELWTNTSTKLVLMNDITFTETVESIGNSSYMFAGTIYGNGKKFVNFTQYDSNSHGLIYYATEGCVLNNVHLYDSCITGGSSYVGGLIGYVESASMGVRLCGCSVEYSTVTSPNNYAGGLVGYVWGAEIWVNASRVDHTCVKSLSVYANSGMRVGGLVGSSCSNTRVTANVHINNSLVNCSEICAKGNSIGGLVGYANSPFYLTNSSVRDCKIWSDSRGDVGGLVGNANADHSDMDGCAVENCTFAGSSYVGGLIGYTFGSFTFTGEQSSRVNYTWVNSTGSNNGSIMGFGSASVTIAPLHTEVYSSTSDNSTFDGLDNSFNGTSPSIAIGSIIVRQNLQLGVDYGYGSAKHVTYVANGATSGSAPAKQAYAPVSTVTVAGQGDIVKAGYVFDGWNTAADGTGTSYQPGATFTITADTTLYAKWTLLTYVEVNTWAGLNKSIAEWTDAKIARTVAVNGSIVDRVAGNETTGINVYGKIILTTNASPAGDEAVIYGNGVGRLFDVNGGNLTLCGNGTAALNLTGGNASVISGISYQNGGAIYARAGNLTINDGVKITNCSAYSGGAVYVCSGWIFTMYGGNIAECTAEYGGGVNLDSPGTFIMTGGSITCCNADNLGGGVYSAGNFTMTGGSITKCTAAYDNPAAPIANAGGIFVTPTTDTHMLNVSGSATVIDNKVNSKLANVGLTYSNNLTLDSAFSGSIGITTFGGAVAGAQFGIAGTGASGAEKLFADENANLVGSISNGKLVWKDTNPYTPSSSSKHSGSTIILSEGQTAPTAYATAAPTVAPTVKPTEKPATPTVIATAKPTTQATQQSPAPFLGIIAGLGAAAVLLRLRK